MKHASDITCAGDERPDLFTRVDHDILTVFGPTLGVYGVAIYTVLSFRAGKKGHCYPGEKSIADMLDCSERQVRNTLHKLESLGLIRIVARKNEKGRATNLYFICEVPTRLPREGEVPASGAGTGDEVPAYGAGTTPGVPAPYAGHEQDEVFGEQEEVFPEPPRIPPDGGSPSGDGPPLERKPRKGKKSSTVTAMEGFHELKAAVCELLVIDPDAYGHPRLGREVNELLRLPQPVTPGELADFKVWAETELYGSRTGFRLRSIRQIRDHIHQYRTERTSVSTESQLQAAGYEIFT